MDILGLPELKLFLNSREFSRVRKILFENVGLREVRAKVSIK